MNDTLERLSLLLFGVAIGFEFGAIAFKTLPVWIILLTLFLLLALASYLGFKAVAR